MRRSQMFTAAAQRARDAGAPLRASDYEAAAVAHSATVTFALLELIVPEDDAADLRARVRIACSGEAGYSDGEFAIPMNDALSEARAALSQAVLADIASMAAEGLRLVHERMSREE